MNGIPQSNQRAGRIRANLAKKGSRFSDSGARQAEDRRR